MGDCDGGGAMRQQWEVTASNQIKSRWWDFRGKCVDTSSGKARMTPWDNTIQDQIFTLNMCGDITVVGEWIAGGSCSNANLAKALHMVLKLGQLSIILMNIALPCAQVFLLVLDSILVWM